MQTTKAQLKAQQILLFYLGHYKGEIDGIWSALSVKAKKAYECTHEFSPAYPNSGLPFGNRDKLPKGVRRNADGTLYHGRMTDEERDNIISVSEQRQASKKAEKEKANVESKETARGETSSVVKVDTSAVQNVEATKSTEEASKSEPVKQEQPTLTSNTNNQNQNHNKKNKHQRRGFN